MCRSCATHFQLLEKFEFSALFLAKISALKRQNFQIFAPKTPHFSRKIRSLDSTFGNLVWFENRFNNNNSNKMILEMCWSLSFPLQCPLITFMKHIFSPLIIRYLSVYSKACDFLRSGHNQQINTKTFCWQSPIYSIVQYVLHFFSRIFKKSMQKISNSRKKVHKLYPPLFFLCPPPVCPL